MTYSNTWTPSTLTEHGQPVYFEGTTLDVTVEDNAIAMVTPMWSDDRGVQAELAMLYVADHLTSAQALALGDALRTVAELDPPISVGAAS